jgi:hypothetical protein
VVVEKNSIKDDALETPEVKNEKDNEKTTSKERSEEEK